MGIIADFSEWQRTIDWSKVSALHQNGTLDGVILRVQHGYTHPDSKYKEYVAGCKQYGIPFGTYAYAAPVSVNDAIAEAKSALGLADPESKCFAVDIEEKDCPDIVAAGQAYIDHLKQNGIKNVGLYSYTGFYNANNLQAIKADWRWIAAYGVNDGKPHTDPQVGGENLWQFTSVAHLDGVSTYVDESQEKAFTFFGTSTPITAIAKFVMQVKVLQDTDVRSDPSHTSGYIKDAHKGEIYNVIQLQNDWHQVALTDSAAGWIDGNNGQNLYWLDNPNLAKTYTVKNGDTLSSIASSNGTTVDALVKKNSLVDPNKIYPGQKLTI